MNIFVFDIETVPDTKAGEKLHQLDGLTEEEIGQAMLHLQKQENGSAFLPHYLHKIIAISVVLRSKNSLKVWSLGDTLSTEADLITRFFAGIDKFAPTLVSWNGAGFDLPVIHYRALVHGIAAPCYWEMGDADNQYRWNNYLNRFHERHTDLMDVLAGYQNRAFAPLDKIASMLGFPGKMGMSGDKVRHSYLNGELENIRHYCETDVLNTFLVYLRFQLIRGRLSKLEYEEEITLVKNTLAQEEKSHFAEFLQHWQS